MDFYGEKLEDWWLYVHGKMPEMGVYVDCGCYHPMTLSNTALWRDRGWTGIAIDANPLMAEQWKEYPGVFINAVIGDGSPGKFAINYEHPGWSKTGEGEPVRTRTLNSILEERGIGKIDLLSIDLEGSEYDALLTLDLEKHQPFTIISEYDTQGIGKDYRVLEYLVKKDYVALHMTEANIIYRRVNKQKSPL